MCDKYFLVIYGPRRHRTGLALVDVNSHCKMMSVMALGGVTSFCCLRDVTNTCKLMRNSSTRVNVGTFGHSRVQLSLGTRHVVQCNVSNDI